MNVSPKTVVHGKRFRPSEAEVSPEDAAAFRADHAATSKVCTRCGGTKGPKPIGEFHKSADRASGLHSWCRSCKRVQQAVYRQTEKGKATHAAYVARTYVKKRVAETERTERRKARKAESRKRRDSLPINKYRSSLMSARSGLAKCLDRMAMLRDRIAICEREIARLEKEVEDDDD